MRHQAILSCGDNSSKREVVRKGKRVEKILMVFSGSFKSFLWYLPLAVEEGNLIVIIKEEIVVV